MFIFRLAQEVDIPQLKEVNMSDLGVVIDEKLLPDYVREHRCYCAETDGHIVALLYWENNFVGNPNFWYVRQITTRSDMRRKGVATDLMNHFLDYARAQHIRRIFCDVRKNNEPSLNLMKELGAIESGWHTGLDEDSADDEWKIFRFDLSGKHQQTI